MQTIKIIALIGQLFCFSGSFYAQKPETMKLFKSEKGRNTILALYQQKLESLAIQYSSKTVATSYGKTHIIRSGDSLKPPMIVVHGSNGCAPVALETYSLLHQKYCVYAVDVLAQPNKSAENRLSMKDESYGKWMNEVINALYLDTVSMAGFSFGGLVILKTLEHDESKVKEVFLTAPAYIVNGNPIKALFKVFIPMKRYMKTKDKAYVEQFLSSLFTEHDSFAYAFLSEVFLEFSMDFSPVPVIKSRKAQQIQTPITLFAADQDLIFPGKKMIKRASKLFPSLVHAELIANSKHVQSKTQNEAIQQIILK